MTNSSSIESKELENAVGAVVKDPEILGGLPVLKGTRLQVHMVASLRKSGMSLDDILLNYPVLTPRHVELAEFYAESHPECAMLSPSWRNRAPKYSITIPRLASTK